MTFAAKQNDEVSPVASAAETARPRPQRRAFERLDIVLSVDVHSGHNFFTGFSANISEGGIFIATDQWREIGSLLEIEFVLPHDKKPITARAQVRWIKPYHAGSDGPTGLGLAFVAIAPEDLRRVQTFVERERAPLFYDD